MGKVNIGVIDSELNNLYLLNKISNDLRFDKLYYYNCFLNENFDEVSNKIIDEKVNKAITYLTNKGVNLILFMGNEIIEHFNFDNIKVKYLLYTDIMIEHYNNDYSQTNIAFFSKSDVTRSNIYQRYLNYSHLYPLNTNRLEKAAVLGQVKTDISFTLVREELKALAHKSVDYAFFTSINSSMFTTELKEYTSLKFIDSYNVCINALSTYIKNNDLKAKGKGEIFIFNNDLTKDILDNVITTKYKLLKVRK